MTDADVMASSSGGADVMLRVSHYALLSGLCQFIPVPFADDIADRHVRKRMIAMLLRRRGRGFRVEEVRPLYTGVSGGLFRRVGSVARGLFLKPVKKLFRTVFFFLAFRRALLEATGATLLGHTLDRLLAKGWLPENATPAERKRQAKRIAEAIDEAWANADRRGLMTVVRQSARHLRGWNPDWMPDRWKSRSASPAHPDATEAATLGDADDLEASLDPQSREQLEVAARQLERGLRDGRGQTLLARFDEMVDQRLGTLS